MVFFHVWHGMNSRPLGFVSHGESSVSGSLADGGEISVGRKGFFGFLLCFFFPVEVIHKYDNSLHDNVDAVVLCRRMRIGRSLGHGDNPRVSLLGSHLKHLPVRSFTNRRIEGIGRVEVFRVFWVLVNILSFSIPATR